MASNPRGIPTLPSTLIRPTNSTPPETVAAPEISEPAEEPSVEPAKGRGSKAPAKAPKPKATNRTGRTVYIPDDLFERIIVQAHRRRVTISDYVVGILHRQVPDHRTRAGGDAEDAA